MPIRRPTLQLNPSVVSPIPKLSALESTPNETMVNHDGYLKTHPDDGTSHHQSPSFRRSADQCNITDLTEEKSLPLSLTLKATKASATTTSAMAAAATAKATTTTATTAAAMTTTAAATTTTATMAAATTAAATTATSTMATATAHADTDTDTGA
jgi:hypothetical protein